MVLLLGEYFTNFTCLQEFWIRTIIIICHQHRCHPHFHWYLHPSSLQRAPLLGYSSWLLLQSNMLEIDSCLIHSIRCKHLTISVLNIAPCCHNVQKVTMYYLSMQMAESNSYISEKLTQLRATHATHANYFKSFNSLKLPQLTTQWSSHNLTQLVQLCPNYTSDPRGSFS